MRLRTGWWLTGVIATGCGGSAPARLSGTSTAAEPRPASLQAKELWTADPPLYLGDAIDPRDVSPALVLLRDRGTVERLDPETGKELWSRRADYLAHPPGKEAPLLAGDYLGDHTTLELVDPATGKTQRTVTLDRRLESEPNDVFWAGDSVIAFSWYPNAQPRAIDPDTGKTRFALAPPHAGFFRTVQVVVRDSAAIVVGRDYNDHAGGLVVWAFDPRTGATLFERVADGSTWAPVVAAEDAGHIYVQRTSASAVWLDAAGREHGTVDGMVRAVSDAYVVVARGDKLVVLRHGVTTPVATVANPKEVGSIVLSGDSLAFTDPSDGHFAWLDLATGKQERVIEAGQQFVLSTDASGTISTAVHAAAWSGNRLHVLTGTRLAAWTLDVKR